MSKTAYRTAVHDAMRDALRDDPRVLLMGEDVGRYGGTYAASKGLLRGVRTRPGARHPPVGAGLRRCRASARRWAVCARSWK